MFLIMCEELIRNGRRSALSGRTPGLTRLEALDRDECGFPIKRR